MTATEIQHEALSRARGSQSLMNYGPIILGFMEKGIPESEIIPRENVFTFHAWKALGRSVRKGEHGVRVVTFISGARVKEDGTKKGYRMPRSVTVFHVSQTDAL